MKYDKDEVARLVAEQREDDARMTAGPWRAGAVETYHVFCADGAELGPERVLLKMNTYFPYDADAAGIARLRNNAGPLADQLEAAMGEVDRIRPLVEAIEQMVPDWNESPGSWTLTDRLPAHLAARREIDRLRAEVEARRPIVEAAERLREWQNSIRRSGVELDRVLDDIVAALDAYRAVQP